MVRQRTNNYKAIKRPKRGRKNAQEWHQAKRKHRRQVRKRDGKKGKSWRNESPANPKASFKHLLAFLPSIGISLATSGLTTLAAFIVGAFLSESAHLPRIAARMPLAIQQSSRLRRLERWLNSKKIDTAAIMGPYARWYLGQIKSSTVYLILDFTTKNDQFLIPLVSALEGKRSIPLYWTIGLANTKGVSRNALAHQVLRQVAKWVPEDKKVVFIADREFRSKEYRKIVSGPAKMELCATPKC